MKIVIFGGSGFIGKALQKKGAEGHEVIALSHAEGNIEEPEALARKLAELRPDAVINLAAILGTMKESPSIEKMFEVNVMGNLKLLRAAYATGIRNYVFTSSMTVHGENQIGSHHDRFSPFNPKHGYSASKAAAELSMMQFLKEAPDMKIVAVRPANVLGRDTNLPHAPIEFIKTVLAGKDIEIYGEGAHEREWVWVDDTAGGILKAAEYAASADPGYHPFFLSTARISMRNLAQKVADKLGGKVVFTPSTNQAFTLTSDMEESQKLLDWAPENKIEDILDKLRRLY